MSTVSSVDQEELLRTLPDVLPLLPLKNTILFPYNIVPLSISSEKSVQAVDHSLSENRMIMLVGQRQPSKEDPGPEDLYTHGTAALIMRMLKLPDGRIRILVQGLARATVDSLSQADPFMQARISRVEEPEVVEET